jgi:hypothetical protein
MNPRPLAPGTIRRNWRPLAAFFALLLLNAYICRELFTMEFLNNLDSNEGVFVALSRFFRENFADQRWFPRFNGGMPIENAYQPLLPMAAAFTGWISGWSVERAFHFVLAFAYCLGPAALFWFAWEWSASLALSLGAGLAYSLTSFAELLLPILRVNADGHWVPLRLYNLIHYAEDPHNLALTLLPFALLFLKRAVAVRSAPNVIAAVLSSACVVLANAFGAVDLALGGICIVLALRRGFSTLLFIGLTAYLLISPWLPPSLIAHIGGDQWTARGSFSAGLTTFLAAGILLALFAALCFVTRRLRPVERFTVLFAPWMVAFPAAYFLLGVTLVPQGNRYQLELELALCLAVGCLFARALENLGRTGQILLVAAVLLLGVRQTRIFRYAARGLIQPVEITQTIEYKIVHWLDRNLPGRRAMVSGDVQFLFNVISNNPQLGGGHEPTAPNWMNRVAVYAINSGDGAGARDADYSIFWLKTFGVQAVTVSAEKSREHYHPTVHPHKFDGVLPVLWHEEDDTIFAVPQRSTSLAHVIPQRAVAVRQPVHGLDLNPVRAYVAALDDPLLPLADLQWHGNSRFTVRAPMKRGQVLSVQVNYLPGWTASMQGHPIPLRGDAVGLMVAEPDREGNCSVDFAWGVTREAWICRILSALAALSLAALSPAALYFSRNARYFLNSS